MRVVPVGPMLKLLRGIVPPVSKTAELCAGGNNVVRRVAQCIAAFSSIRLRSSDSMRRSSAVTRRHDHEVVVGLRQRIVIHITAPDKRVIMDRVSAVTGGKAV